MGGHGSSSYLVRDGKKLLFFERGLGPVEVSDAATSSILEATFGEGRPVRYSYLLGNRRSQYEPRLASAVTSLGRAMSCNPRRMRDSCIPAGYTYLGQFVFHDITHQRSPRLDKPGKNERTPSLDLDSVWNLPLVPQPPARQKNSQFLALGCTNDGGIPLIQDLPRITSGQQRGCPVIGDYRNDAFLPLAQIHMLLIKFHNAIARWLGGDVSIPARYQERWLQTVRGIWIHHFQSVILHDYLFRLIDDATYKSVMARKRQVIAIKDIEGQNFHSPEWLSLEFAVAVGRFGHSMIRESYGPWNRDQPRADLKDFMEFSYLNSGDRLKKHKGALPRAWATDWHALFDLADWHEPADSALPLKAACIDTSLAPALSALPTCVAERSGCSEKDRKNGPWFSLAERTLKRGYDLGLATAQEAIELVNKLVDDIAIVPLSKDELVAGESDAVKDVFCRYPELSSATPLWYYILKEADVDPHTRGSKLGPLASRIVMETLHAAIEAHENSILQQPKWRPCLPAKHRSHFTMSDLIRFSTNVDPLRNLERAHAKTVT